MIEILKQSVDDPFDFSDFLRVVPQLGKRVEIASLYNTIYKPQHADKVRRGHDNTVANGKIPGSPAYGYRLNRFPRSGRIML